MQVGVDKKYRDIGEFVKGEKLGNFISYLELSEA